MGKVPANTDSAPGGAAVADGGSTIGRSSGETDGNGSGDGSGDGDGSDDRDGSSDDATSKLAGMVVITSAAAVGEGDDAADVMLVLHGGLPHVIAQKLPSSMKASLHLPNLYCMQQRRHTQTGVRRGS